MSFDVKKYIYSFLFSLILVFSMNIQGLAASIDYEQKIEQKENSSNNTEEDKSNFNSSNSSEENETKNNYESLEKFHDFYSYYIKFQDNNNELEHIYFHIDLFSKLKLSLNTPPPEIV